MRVDQGDGLRERLNESFSDSLRALQLALPALLPEVTELARGMMATFSRGGTVFWVGNGGSAAQAQHAAAELMGRFRHSRRPLPSLSLTPEAAVWSAIANDFGFPMVFARQIEALVRPGDLVVALTTSGRSENVLAALEAARRLGATTAALAGSDGTALAARCDVVATVDATEPAHVQEIHLAIIHALCLAVEEWLPDEASV